MNDPFFGRSLLGDNWRVAGAQDQPLEDRRDALLELSRHRDKLPGLVFFIVPEGEEEHPKWQMLIRASRPHCRCASRRVLHPTHGRAQFVSASPPVTVTLEYRASSPHMRSEPLLVMPHGGDAASAYMSWQIFGGRIEAAQRPYLAENHGATRLFANQAGFGQHRPSSHWGAELRNVVEALQQYGGLHFYARIASEGLIAHHTQLCAIRQVVYGQRYMPYVTLEMDAAVATLRPDGSEPFHMCVGDALPDAF
jgi:hypothetical protein